MTAFACESRRNAAIAAAIGMEVIDKNVSPASGTQLYKRR